jgi:hypothetical protein
MMPLVDVVDVAVSKLLFSRWFSLVSSALFYKQRGNIDFRALPFVSGSNAAIFLGVNVRKIAPFYRLGMLDFVFPEHGANYLQNAKKLLRRYTWRYSCVANNTQDSLWCVKYFEIF